MRLVKQFVKILHCSKLIHNGIIIANIISIIVIGRFIYRTNPDNINTQFTQIIQPGQNASQVPFTVSVRILKTDRVNLIYNGFLPPYFLGMFPSCSFSVHPIAYALNIHAIPGCESLVIGNKSLVSLLRRISRTAIICGGLF